MKQEKAAPVIACIIFNSDTILLNAETIIISILLDKAEEYGLNIELDDALSLFSEKGIEENIKQLKDLIVINVANDFEEEVRKKIYEELRSGLDVKEGVRRILEIPEMPFFVLSNVPQEEIEFNLKLTNLLNLFTPEKILTTSEIEKQNPDTALYSNVATTIGYQPEECFVIADSIVGLKNAVEEGFNVYGLSNGFNENEMRETGAIVFEEIKELSNFLKIL
ncbi:HAD hydrolase-like protein [Flavobacterium sp. AC]|uniref:HAD hydrolase-like protein n=1 Tax=Flavobacterium azizsancarii TaxID=2961580 RepID=A0ABT4W751_9FLAO|nr:HAD hydrolase-like protein [Flavobacterium azizsancarii]MDA6068386.1 HAD hydrolase-like protein [Flavobacterium azizsancarii]